MPWSIFRLLSSFLYASSTHIDDYLVDNFSHKFSVATLTVFSSLVGLIPAFIFLLFASDQAFQLSPSHLLLALVCGVLNFFSLFFYLFSLNYGEATVSVIFYRLPPVLTLLGGWFFLKETLLPLQILGIIITVIATILFSLDFSNPKIKLHTHQVGFMLLSVICTTGATILYKFVATNHTYAVASFWYFLTLFLCSLPLILFSKTIRTQLSRAIFSRYPRKKQFILAEFTNEALYLSGDTASNYADSLAPVALSSALGSFQPVFVFLIGLILHFLRPRLLKGKYDRSTIIQKIIGLILIVTGSLLIVR